MEKGEIEIHSLVSTVDLLYSTVPVSLSHVYSTYCTSYSTRTRTRAFVLVRFTASKPSVAASSAAVEIVAFTFDPTPRDC
jgi:hypothetical protein